MCVYYILSVHILDTISNIYILFPHAFYGKLFVKMMRNSCCLNLIIKIVLVKRMINDW